MFSNVKTKKSPSKDNSSKSKLTLLTHDLRYEIEITIKKNKKKSQSSRFNNQMPKKKKQF
jgi:hypothetical protein